MFNISEASKIYSYDFPVKKINTYLNIFKITRNVKYEQCFQWVHNSS